MTKTLHLAGDTPDHKLYVRALQPSTIEICTAKSPVDLKNGKGENTQTISLKGK